MPSVGYLKAESLNEKILEKNLGPDLHMLQLFHCTKYYACFIYGLEAYCVFVICFEIL